MTMHGAGTAGKRTGPSLDESSWQWKYRNGERPVHDYDLVVKIDSKLPALPPIADVIKKPSKDDFQKKMKDLDKKADELKVNVQASRS